MAGCFDNVRCIGKPKPTPAMDNTKSYYTKPPASSVGWYWTPRVASKEDYPLDLDFSERITRPRLLTPYYPVPGAQMNSDQKPVFMAIMDVNIPANDAIVRRMSAHKRNVTGPEYDNNLFAASVGDVVLDTVKLG